jgi:hypothetical protein
MAIGNNQYDLVAYEDGTMRKSNANKVDTISIDILRKGDSESYETIVRGVPSGFPPEFIKSLGDAYCEGFSDGQIFSQHPNLRIPGRRGRAVDPVARSLGEKARALKMRGLSYGQIALQICEKRAQEGHECDRKCADRIRQRAKTSALR